MLHRFQPYHRRKLRTPAIDGDGALWASISTVLGIDHERYSIRRLTLPQHHGRHSVCPVDRMCMRASHLVEEMDVVR